MEDHGSVENQITLLEFRIRELEENIVNMRDKDEPYRVSNDFSAAVRRTTEQLDELQEAIGCWLSKSQKISEVMKKIEEAPIKHRDRLLLAFFLGTKCQNRGGGDDGGLPAMLRMFMPKG